MLEVRGLSIESRSSIYNIHLFINACIHVVND